MDFRLREILNERGISIRAFAAQMGVVPNSLPLSVTYAPSLSSLQKYARVLNMPCVELLRKPEHPTPMSESDMTDKFDLNEMALANIKRIMSEKQLLLKQVAEGAGISVQGLSQTLKNNKMSITTLEKIARGLGVEAWALLVDPEAERKSHEIASFGTLQPVRQAVEAEPEDQVFAPETGDLFAQYPDDMTADEMYQMELLRVEQEQQQAATDGKLLADGEYRYGNLTITLRDGRVTVC